MPEKISHYTPFRSFAFAFVQVKRGGDEATLSGLELFIDFEGNAYKTTLRSPDANGMRRYVFNLSDMAANDKAPKYASVAPIFLERGRSFVGDITSNALIPYAKIVLNITELVLELDGDDDNFVIVLNNSVQELDYDVCNPSSPVEDPWGGCAVVNGDLTNVTEDWNLDKWAHASGELDASWGGSNYVLFSYSGSNNNCLNGISKTVCFTLVGVSEDPDYFNVGETENLTEWTPCSSGSKYYVYDNSNCE